MSEEKTEALPRVDMSSVYSEMPPKINFILPGFVAGTVGLLTAPGSAGKTFFALQTAIAVAGDSDLSHRVGLLDYPRSGLRVAYFGGEDPLPIVCSRLHSIGRSLFPLIHGETEECAAKRAQAGMDAAGVSERLQIFSTLGRRPNFVDEGDKTLKFFCRMVLESRAELAIFDTLSRFHAAEENDNGAMSRVISSFEALTALTGTSVLILHHTAKAAALNGQGDLQQSARGASAIVDNARFSASLTTMTKAEAENLAVRADGPAIAQSEESWRYVRFTPGKVNYGPRGGDRWYRRNENGILIPVELIIVKKTRRVSNDRAQS